MCPEPDACSRGGDSDYVPSLEALLVLHGLILEAAEV